MKFSRSILFFAVWVAAGLVSPLVMAQEESASEADGEIAAIIESLKWVEGPKLVNVGPVATFNVPAGYLFLNAADTRVFLEKVTQNPASGQEYFFGPENGEWWATFEYSETGHVKDDEKIDADELLESMRENQDEGNKERAKKGWPQLLNLSWKQAPFYDPETRRLEWALTFINSDDKQEGVNYETRLLGRVGVTSATLVVSPEKLAAVLPEFKNAVSGYNFVVGQHYNEYKEGDKLAEYGLAALVAGGAAAVLLKSGLLAKYGKILIVGLLAALAFIGKFFSGLFRRRKKLPDAVPVKTADINDLSRDEKRE
ncbi:MAG: DUF2167 domain-containing protein [Zoogloeaceae bacterium]|jgi:uncharacterized membrane-anchored protein|nr:DUF2167 domain-containing protein [Zoogloeaceae bacterium]